MSDPLWTEPFEHEQPEMFRFAQHDSPVDEMDLVRSYHCSPAYRFKFRCMGKGEL